MSRSLLMGFAIAVAFATTLSGASTVTLTGGCPAYVINASRSYITFNITNTGNGTATSLWMSVSFPGIDSVNATAAIQEIGPGAHYSKQFHLSRLPEQGSYVVNINANYMQAGNGYATVFPCMIYIGNIVGSPMLETASIKGNRFTVNITNTAPQSIEANVTAVVPPGFSVQNATKTVTVDSGRSAALHFDIASPAYNDASFPIIGELSYEYNGVHYAWMASAALVFGSTGAVGGGNGGSGMGLAGWIVGVVVVVIVVLIMVSIFQKRSGLKSKKENEEGAK